MTSKEKMIKLKQDIEESTVTNATSFECVYMVKSCLLHQLDKIETDLELLDLMLDIYKPTLESLDKAITYNENSNIPYGVEHEQNKDVKLRRFKELLKEHLEK